MNVKSICTILVFVTAVVCFADNAGCITGVSTFIGNDGKQYIRVESSITGVLFGADPNKAYNPFYIPWNSSDVVAASDYASFLKALQDHSITINLLSGGTDNRIDGVWRAVVSKWTFQKP